MRTAISPALVVAVCVLGSMAQDLPKPKPADAAAQPKPAASQESQTPAVAPPSAAPADPSKMAAPASNGGAKPAGVAGIDAKSYVLGAEDQILITVWRNAEFSGSHMIRPDGKITINLVGEVQAALLTPEQLGDSIKERLKKILVEPDVSVSVTQVNSKRYFIEGEVRKPGEYKLVVPTRILEALVNAGGFQDFAKQTDITIMRGTTRLKFNYKAAIRGKNLEQNIFLEPGDIIIVK